MPEKKAAPKKAAPKKEKAVEENKPLPKKSKPAPKTEEKPEVVEEVAPKEEAKIDEPLFEAKVAEEAPKEEFDENAYVSLRHVDKIYDNNVQAVFDFNLDIAKKEFIVFVGPSGCGKSTTLRMIAGLEDISSGELYIDGVYSNDRTPKDRDIAMVFQSYALYPHMTVYNNMAFGLKIRHLPKAEISERVHKAAQILQIEEYLQRKPKALSGGQRQRVALGRAIVRNAKVFLMDEPLSNLDAKLRVQMRSEIIKLHEALGATTIYVTHDQTEAMTMASRIVVMKLGRIQQIGAPIEIYNKPANLFVATFIGSPAMNVLRGTYENGKITFLGGHEVALPKEAIEAHDAFFQSQILEDKAELENLKTRSEELSARVGEKGKKNRIGKELDEVNEAIASLEERITNDEKAINGEPHDIAYGIRPEDIHEVSSVKPESKYSEPYELKVAVAELLGHEYYVHTDFGGIDLIAKIPLTHEMKIGDDIALTFDLKKAHIFDSGSEKLIY